MIFAFTGRRSNQLPVEALDLVAERVRKLLTQTLPSAVVGAAACGADLLILEEALRLSASTGGRPDVRVVLPTPEAEFRTDSVEPEWRARFDAVLAELRRRGMEPTVDAARGKDDVYSAGNVAILDVAGDLAAKRGERAVVLVVASPGQGQYSRQMVDDAALRDIRHLRIDPAVTRAQQRRCFVIMPYGVKPDPQRKFDMDCDLTYRRWLVPALEHAQLHYRRADETVDPGVVLRPMIDDIARADVVIADLATGNFNVGWELGLRHLLRSRSTILIKPSPNVTAPFDVASLRTVSYDYSEDGFDDDAIIEAWAQLEPLLVGGPGAAAQATDSPVETMMDDVRLARIGPLAGEMRRLQQLRDTLAEARDLRDAAIVEAVVAEADASDLGPDDLRLVHAEAGTILRRLGVFDRARALLEPIVSADEELRRPAAHQELAMAYYRPADAGPEDLARAYAILEVLRLGGGYPETESLLGAIAKRRAAQVSGAERVAELGRARDRYLAEFTRDLNAYYAGVNVLAVDAVLALVHDDTAAREQLERLLPVVRLAAELRLQRAPGDHWARATLGEVELVASLAASGGDDADAAVVQYREALALRPLPDEVASMRNQLDWYQRLGVDASALAPVRTALERG